MGVAKVYTTKFQFNIRRRPVPLVETLARHRLDTRIRSVLSASTRGCNGSQGGQATGLLNS